MKPRTEARKPRTRRPEAVILFAVGPYRFAMPASEVDEIRDMHGLTPASLHNGPAAVRKVHYLLRRDRHTYHVVDASFHFHMLPSKASRIMVLRGGAVALTADSIDRMTEMNSIAPLPQAFQGEERKWFRGVALIDDAIVPIVNSNAVLSNSEVELARAALAAAKGASA